MVADASDRLRIDPLVNAAYLAGRGHSAEEIAAAVGARSGDAITEALRLYDVRLDSKPFGSRVLPARVAREALAAFEKAALARGIDAVEIAERILSVVGREISIDGLLDDRK